MKSLFAIASLVSMSLTMAPGTTQAETGKNPKPGKRGKEEKPVKAPPKIPEGWTVPEMPAGCPKVPTIQGFRQWGWEGVLAADPSYVATVLQPIADSRAAGIEGAKAETELAELKAQFADIAGRHSHSLSLVTKEALRGLRAPISKERWADEIEDPIESKQRWRDQQRKRVEKAKAAIETAKAKLAGVLDPKLKAEIEDAKATLAAAPTDELQKLAQKNLERAEAALAKAEAALAKAKLAEAPDEKLKKRAQKNLEIAEAALPRAERDLAAAEKKLKALEEKPVDLIAAFCPKVKPYWEALQRSIAPYVADYKEWFRISAEAKVKFDTDKEYTKYGAQSMAEPSELRKALSVKLPKEWKGSGQFGFELIPFFKIVKQKLAGESWGFSMTQYKSHSWSEYSTDIWIQSKCPDENKFCFFARDRLLSFFRAMLAAEAVSNPRVRWRALYNDFEVAKTINAEAGARKIHFQWIHGPGPYKDHVHLDIMPLWGFVWPKDQKTPKEKVNQPKLKWPKVKQPAVKKKTK